jgi:hypothetical protein
MTTPAVIVNQPEYRLALVCPDRQRLLAIAKNDGVLLPRVTVPPYTRFAEQLTRTVKEKWGFDSVVLDVLPDSLTSASCAVIEIRSPNRIGPESLFAVHMDAIGHDDLTTGERVQLKALLSSAPGDKQSFRRLRWLDDVVSWIELAVCGSDLKLTGNFRQLNGAGPFCLIRFETNSSALWFKAVGEPNLHEFPISVALSKLFPAYVPSLLAIDPEWNAWLTQEAEGATLDENSGFDLWLRAAITLANLQIESCASTDNLLQAGCKNVRISALLEYVDPFFEVMGELMGLQPKVPPPILDQQELRALSAEIKGACYRLGELGITDTLGHLDFNPGNILLSPTHCVFLDWAEAYVGHPFLTFEYLLAHFRRIHTGEMTLESKLKSAYIECWRPFVSAEKLEELAAISPLIAVFAYAVTAGTWKDASRLQSTKVAGYLRSLTRRMQREARLQDEWRARCLN